MKRTAVKIRFLNYLSNKGIIDFNDFYVITLDDEIKLQGELNDKKRMKYEKLFGKFQLQEHNWIEIQTKNFRITLTF